MLAKRLGLPWSVQEFDNKSRSRISKFRSNIGYLGFHEDAKNAFVVNKAASSLWLKWRDNSDDGNMGPEETAAYDLAQALAKVASLIEMLEDPHRRSK